MITSAHSISHQSPIQLRCVIIRALGTLETSPLATIVRKVEPFSAWISMALQQMTLTVLILRNLICIKAALYQIARVLFSKIKTQIEAIIGKATILFVPCPAEVEFRPEQCIAKVHVEQWLP